MEYRSLARSDAIAVSISESDFLEVRASIATLRGKLMPHLKTLSAQESVIPKIGDKTAAFVQKALEYGQQNKDLVPSFLDLGAMATNTKAVQALRELAQGLNPIPTP